MLTLEDYKIIDEMIQTAIKNGDVDTMRKGQHLRDNIKSEIDKDEYQKSLVREDVRGKNAKY